MEYSSRWRTISSYSSIIIASRFLSCIKGSFIIGSRTAYLSLSSLCTPLTGVYGGWRGSFFPTIVTSLSCIIKGKVGIVSYSFVKALSLPTLGASLYWAWPTRWYRMGVPLICALLFIVHPIGGSVWFYSLYWLIPFTISACNPRSFFLHALASTFIAHAIGSVIWLYSYSLPPAAWMGVMPLVLGERLASALGITAVFYGMEKIHDCASRLYHGRQSTFCTTLRVETMARP